MVRLKDCGYSARFRSQVVQKAKKLYQKQIERDRLGIKPLYRSRELIILDRQKRKSLNQNWWNKGSKVFTSVMFVPPTPGGELAARLKKREAELAGSTGLRIKFVEQGGVKLKNKLVRADPFPSAECGKLKCPVCKMTEFSTPAERGTFWTKCTTKSVGYRIICKNCQKSSKLASYEGETGRPARVRLGEHFAGLKNKTKSNPLHKHQIPVHPG